MRRIIVLSGRIGSGKSALAERLARRYGAMIVKSREIIANLLPEVSDRDGLQREGERLDAETLGRWLAHALKSRSFPEDALVVVDARPSQRVTLPGSPPRPTFPASRPERQGTGVYARERAGRLLIRRGLRKSSTVHP